MTVLRKFSVGSVLALAVFFVDSNCSVATAEDVPRYKAGASNLDGWSVVGGDSKKEEKAIAVASTDGKTELVVTFRKDPLGLQMDMVFLDKPVHRCNNLWMEATTSTLLINGTSAPMVKQCEYGMAGKGMMGVIGPHAITEALIQAKQGTLTIFSSDGSFKHTYSTSKFKELAEKEVKEYEKTDAYKAFASAEATN
ncbi:hypothetical protein [Paraburkholderia antibiotica]|uniref:DUF4412 domain-containing protein n=1 Tax=Paraburkholderia antibiotica TaxID=2728839 RepID=A0A7Y0A0I1_9BURK|nr:hypothetical protein [Paraburkholderia antibiotica]NML34258.1 hypothetical protein [Paraburkholderia antibiotica]